MEARLSITRVSSTHGDGCINISIEDGKSGLLILSIDVGYEEFTKAITGQAYIKAKFKNIPNEFIVHNIGKKKETKYLTVAKPKTNWPEEKMKKEVDLKIKKSGELKDGWMVWDDGCRSQQNSDMHRVVLYRYVNS